MANPAQRAIQLLTSKIHSKIPITPREEQQLYSLLTTSFRRQLDAEFLGLHASQPAKPEPLSAVQSQLSKAPQKPSSYAAAAKHIETILTNPLFAVKPNHKPIAWTRRNSDPAVNASDARDILEKPYEWFQQQMAKGTATFSKACMCVQMLQKNPAEITAQSKIGTHIVHWMGLNNLLMSPEFIQELSFTQELVPILVTEQNLDVIWPWITANNEELGELTNLSPRFIHRWKAVVIGSAVSHVLSTDGINAALATFLYSVDVQKPDNLFTSDYILAEHTLMEYLCPASRRAPDATRHATRHATIEPALYTAFMDKATTYSQYSAIIQAHLALFHPTTPSVEPALRLFLADDHLAQVQRLTQRYAGKRSSKVERFRLASMNLGLATMKQVIRDGRLQQALVLLQMMEETFATELGVIERRQQQQKEGRRRHKAAADTLTEPDQNGLVDLNALDWLGVQT